MEFLILNGVVHYVINIITTTKVVAIVVNFRKENLQCDGKDKQRKFEKKKTKHFFFIFYFIFFLFFFYYYVKKSILSLSHFFFYYK